LQPKCLIIAFGCDTFNNDTYSSIDGGMDLDIEDYITLGEHIRKLCKNDLKIPIVVM